MSPVSVSLRPPDFKMGKKVFTFSQKIRKWPLLGQIWPILTHDFQNFGCQKLYIFCFYFRKSQKLGEKLCHFEPEMGHTCLTPHDGLLVRQMLIRKNLEFSPRSFVRSSVQKYLEIRSLLLNIKVSGFSG